MLDIKKLDFVDLINKYKDLIGEEVVDIIVACMMPYDKKASSDFRANCEEVMRRADSYAIGVMSKEKEREMKINILYNDLNIKFSKDTLAKNENLKISFILEVYRRFEDKMSKKQRSETLDLLIGKKNHRLFSSYSAEYDLVDIDFISREKPEKLDDLKDETKKHLLHFGIERGLTDGYFEKMLKDEYEDEYGVFMKKVLIDFLVKSKRMSAEDFKQAEKDSRVLNDILDEKLDQEYAREAAKFFENNLQMVDEQTVLLNLAARIMLGIRLEKGEKIEKAWLDKESEFESEEEKKLKNRNSIAVLKEIYKYLNPLEDKNKEFGIVNEDGDVVSLGSKENIKKFLDRCTENDYLNDEDIENIHKDLLEGKLVEDPDARRIANIGKEDLLEMIKANKEDKENILPVAMELTEYLRQIEKINDEEILESYLNGKLPLELIMGIEMKGLSEEELSQKLKEIYFETFVKDNEKEEKKEKLKKAERLAKLFNLYDEFDKDNAIIEISYLFEGEDINTMIVNLKKIGLIDLAKTIELAEKKKKIDVLLRVYNEENLKPVEVRRLYDDGKIDLDNLAELIRKLPANGDKFMIIGSIFPDKQDAEIREILKDECIEIKDGIKNSGKGNKRKKPVEPKPKNYKEHITDPFARLSLIQILDEDYSFEMLSDGHAIIKLPNLGKVVIEKMLDKDKKFSYGSATYILSEDYYDRNHINIVKDDKINRSKMIEDLGLGEVDRIIHGVHSWGKNIKKYFKTDDKTRYSDEDREKIEEAIERIEEINDLRENK